MSQPGLSPIEEALDEIRAGRPVIVVDDADRENEGDFIMAAEHAGADWLGFVIRYSSGIVCAAMGADRADALELPPMVDTNTDPRQTAYTVTVDAAHGVTTGVSGADRAHTIRLLADPATQPDALSRPGHILPLRAREGGVLTRTGHTEATVDLCRLAGCQPVGLLSEVMRDDGEMMRLPELVFFARRHGLVVISIADLVAWRLRNDVPEGVERVC
ncbi:3,4-dihydroxy-2-butanone-4-phosphate synthase [Mameliella sediminis]|uniref:3,4-dihydroxy-2-butanone-4-phosphate synthase n=1 Tax=Mameliella sediminis TaxID=2836866 RepID=UPI001C4960AB|nr:3,4-dihydroxy-2-butanone-4-phosphate synthase [Mameliella sediminis]MBY6114867.1 3,4-dihydroxy-2-butanone-4-phosphate synthase [Antarctobacter heliothermus]MBY6144440.1 3,4-dihydroxy-2-butanone-4-phosphate synthase [Mameliella alba]MBV7392652.1 3,4-dihydroxy-2-butanone-4-phosphate synthase [Mameliella sediminis]MBY6163502.1 3,4-dihydroxy-2-butanone-4-phosphate synthase [Mameliella alba]MBY6171765.1 3,4-dihydroxy-2-butanone-4-phosphate synthase [Mameliella alba]